MASVSLKTPEDGAAAGGSGATSTGAAGGAPEARGVTASIVRDKIKRGGAITAPLIAKVAPFPKSPGAPSSAALTSPHSARSTIDDGVSLFGMRTGVLVSNRLGAPRGADRPDLAGIPERNRPCYEGRGIGMKLAIRHRLVTIILLGVVTWSLSVVALVQLLSTSTANRVERAREAMLDEMEHL